MPEGDWKGNAMWPSLLNELWSSNCQCRIPRCSWRLLARLRGSTNLTQTQRVTVWKDLLKLGSSHRRKNWTSSEKKKKNPLQHPSHPTQTEPMLEKKTPPLLQICVKFDTTMLFLLSGFAKLRADHFIHGLQTGTEVQTESGSSRPSPSSTIKEGKTWKTERTWWSFAALQKLHSSPGVIWVSDDFLYMNMRSHTVLIM